MHGFNKEELKVLKKLNTPVKIQDWLEQIEINFEENGDTYMSPRRVLREKKAHCLEGALVAAAALWLQGRPPLLMDLTSAKDDADHVVALFKEGGYWGAISKTNHAVLRYREPIYRDLRELAVSYFHEYFLDTGRKTLKSYSTKPLDLRKYVKDNWMTSEEDLWFLQDELDNLPHADIVPPALKRKLRLADPVEIEAGKVTRWKRKIT